MINAHQSGQFLTQYNWVTTLGPSVRQSTLQLPEGLVVCSHLGTGLRMCKDRSSYQRVIFRQCTQENSRDPEKLWTVGPWPLFLKTQSIKDTPVKKRNGKHHFLTEQMGKLSHWLVTGVGMVNYSPPNRKWASAIVLLDSSLSCSIHTVKSRFVIAVLSSTFWHCFSS